MLQVNSTHLTIIVNSRRERDEETCLDGDTALVWMWARSADNPKSRRTTQLLGENLMAAWHCGIDTNACFGCAYDAERSREARPQPATGVARTVALQQRPGQLRLPGRAGAPPTTATAYAQSPRGVFGAQRP